MKKYISILLCFALAVSIICPVNVYAVDFAPASVVVEAQQTLTELDVTKPITKDTWGEATIHVDKNSANTTLASWNNQEVEDVEMDLYFRWDKDFLYVGVVSEDTNYSKTYLPAFDGGDGIELKINVGTSRNNLRKHFKIKYGEISNTYVSFVDENGDYKSNQAADTYGYVSNIQCIDNKMHVAIKVPFADLDLSTSDVKAGLVFSYSMLRVSASKNYDDDGYEGYINVTGKKDDGINPQVFDGWLSWGDFFDTTVETEAEPAKKALNVNCTTDNVIVLSDKVAQTGNVIRANKAYNSVDLENILSWGKPAIHVDKNSYNTSLHDHNKVKAEDLSMDIYTMWDDKNLYIGVVSEDNDVQGADNSWSGDGIQFKIQYGKTISSDAKNIYFTLNKDGVTASIGDEKLKYDYLKIVDGVMYAAIAIPFEGKTGFGLVESDVKAGATFAIDLLRISGTEKHEYSGWLAWGAFFGAGDAYNDKSFYDNVIVLSNDIADMATVVKADKIVGEIDLNDVTSWGKPTIHVDKNSYNTSLHDHNKVKAEDISMDIYTRWDDKNLYIGVVSEDNDVQGADNSWSGDGIQFKIQYGKTMSSDAKNIYFTLNKDGVTASIGDEKLKYDYLKIVDGVMYAAIAIPFEGKTGFGLVESDVKAGTTFVIDLLRISGTEKHEYSGWLAWGAFFGAGDAYNDKSFYDNVIVLSDNVASTATTITSDKATSRVDLNDIKSWGQPAIHVDKNSYNTSLHDHNKVKAEDISMDIYTTWDDKNLYIGVVSEDNDVQGADNSWSGDGIQFKIQYGKTISSDAKNIYFTLNKDGVTASIGDEKLKYDYLKIVDGVMYAAIAIPFEGKTGFGLVESDVKAGATFAIDLLRISGTEKHEYSGWLAWGAFFGAGDAYNPKSVCDNLIVLIDSNAVNIDVSDDVSDAFKSLLLNIKDSAGTTVSTDGMNFEFGDSSAHKILTTANGTYVVYLSSSNMVENNGNGAVNEFTLVKIANGEASELGYGYVYGGLVDLVADKDGNIYVIGGSSSYTMDKLTNKNNGAEKAVLNIFKYNEKTGAINGQKSYRAFTNEADHHTFLSATVDKSNGKIYAVFAGTDADGKYTDIEYFTYDLNTSKWNKESTAYKINIADITNSAVFAIDGGVGFVCSDGKEIHYFNANGKETKIDEANLEDIYVDANGVNILCGKTLKIVTIKADGAVVTTIVTSQVESEGYNFKFAQIGSKRYIVAMDAKNAAVNAANVLLYSDTFELISETKLDKIIKYTSSFMVADDLTDGAETVTILFAGSRGIVKSWYTAQISVTPAAEAVE